MAHHHAAKKAIRQSARRRVRNRAYKTAIKSALKTLETAAGEEKGTAYRKAQALLDQGVRRNIISRNAASRKKSQLARSLAAPKP